MIVGIGIDAIEIERVDWEKLGERVYTLAELAYIRKKGAAAQQTAAGLFAAKEAALKAVGTGIGPLSLRDVEVTHDEHGRPLLCLSEKGKTFIGEHRAHLSITHTKELAMAQVILESE